MSVKEKDFLPGRKKIIIMLLSSETLFGLESQVKY